MKLSQLLDVQNGLLAYAGKTSFPVLLSNGSASGQHMSYRVVDDEKHIIECFLSDAKS